MGSNDLFCSYGDAGAFGCRVALACQSEVWEERGGRCTQPASCPSEAPKSGTECRLLGGADFLGCAYSDGALCNCYHCDRFSPEHPACSNTGSTWICWQPSPDLDC
ncbi:MAG TPA: hypothetical protein VGC79_05625, partial [Polyangiaceae bacterium]